MTGTVKEICQSKNGGKLLIYDDIDTTGGQSGSPVIKISKNNRLT